MIRHNAISDNELRRAIKSKSLSFGGHAKLKIYGTLTCSSGKRMKREHRIFFNSETEALNNGYRPCGHCMKEHYNKWRRNLQPQ